MGLKDCGGWNCQKQRRRAIYVLYVQSEGYTYRGKCRKANYRNKKPAKLELLEAKNITVK